MKDYIYVICFNREKYGNEVVICLDG